MVPAPVVQEVIQPKKELKEITDAPPAPEVVVAQPEPVVVAPADETLVQELITPEPEMPIPNEIVAPEQVVQAEQAATVETP